MVQLPGTTGRRQFLRDGFDDALWLIWPFRYRISVIEKFMMAQEGSGYVGLDDGVHLLLCNPYVWLTLNALGHFRISPKRFPHSVISFSRKADMEDFVRQCCQH